MNWCYTRLLISTRIFVFCRRHSRDLDLLFRALQCLCMQAHLLISHMETRRFLLIKLHWNSLEKTDSLVRAKGIWSIIVSLLVEITRPLLLPCFDIIMTVIKQVLPIFLNAIILEDRWIYLLEFFLVWLAYLIKGVLSFIPQMLKILLREWFKYFINFISVTECGFGADIGMEKFFNIKCRYSGNYSIFHQI